MTDAQSLATRLPSLHVVRAALHVASILGERAASLGDARESYWHHATGGTFSPADLALGEQLLLDCGLVVGDDGRLVATDELGQMLEGTVDDAVVVICRTVMAQPITSRELGGESLDALVSALDSLVADEERRRELLLELGNLFDDTRRSLIGAIGENCVVEQARAELRELGHHGLARGVHRVSLISDQLGYDVVAPRIDGPPRLLEVKTTGRRPQTEFEFFISRNEINTGLRTSDWALVACAVLDETRGIAEILGWCPATALRDLLPSDAEHGRWTEARLSLPREHLIAGLPRLVA